MTGKKTFKKKIFRRRKGLKKNGFKKRRNTGILIQRSLRPGMPDAMMVKCTYQRQNVAFATAIGKAQYFVANGPARPNIYGTPTDLGESRYFRQWAFLYNKHVTLACKARVLWTNHSGAVPAIVAQGFTNTQPGSAMDAVTLSEMRHSSSGYVGTASGTGKVLTTYFKIADIVGQKDIAGDPRLNAYNFDPDVNNNLPVNRVYFAFAANSDSGVDTIGVFCNVKLTFYVLFKEPYMPTRIMGHTGTAAPAQMLGVAADFGTLEQQRGCIPSGFTGSAEIRGD